MAPDLSCVFWLPQKAVQGASPRSLQFQRQPQEEIDAEAQRGFAGGFQGLIGQARPVIWVE